MQGKTHIHSREISIKTFDIDQDTMLIEGELKDIQPSPWYFYTTGEFRQPGYSHHISAQMTVQLPDLVIRDARAQMSVVAHEECRQVEHQIDAIVGLSILQKAFKKKLLELMGGTKGCIHLTGLVLDMASAGIQGQWGYYNRVENGALLRAPEYDTSILLNSCWLWREGSPFARRIPQIEDEISRYKQFLQSGSLPPDPDKK